MTSQIEEAFVCQAMAIGLAAKIASLTADVTQAIADLPPGAGQRHRARLEEQRQTLAQPSLRTLAALARAICLEDPAKAWKRARPRACSKTAASNCSRRSEVRTFLGSPSGQPRE